VNPGVTAGVTAGPAPLAAIDVEEWRTCTARVAVVRRVGAPTVVLGSRQRPGPEMARRAEAGGIVLVGRRSGGSAVALEPTGTLWVDLWLPAGDPLWLHDVSKAALWVGSWWERAFRLGGLGRPDAPAPRGAAERRAVPGPAAELQVHTGAMEAGTLADVICFSSAAPGELFAGRRKVVGIAQWRCRSGALFQCVAYRRWDPGLLAAVLAPGDRAFMRATSDAGAGIDTLVAPDTSLATVTASLRRHGPPGPPFRWSHRSLTVRAPGGSGAHAPLPR